MGIRTAMHVRIASIASTVQRMVEPVEYVNELFVV